MNDDNQESGAQPLPVAVNGGRKPDGTFAKGSKWGKGNPLNKRVQQLRATLLRSVTPTVLKAIIARLVYKAASGDVVAAREVLDRVLGKPSPTELLERIERLEQIAAERKDH